MRKEKNTFDLQVVLFGLAWFCLLLDLHFQFESTPLAKIKCLIKTSFNYIIFFAVIKNLKKCVKVHIEK